MTLGRRPEGQSQLGHGGKTSPGIHAVGVNNCHDGPLTRMDLRDVSFVVAATRLPGLVGAVRRLSLAGTSGRM